MLLVCRFFLGFSALRCTLGCTYYQYACSTTAPTSTVAVAVPMSTYEGCCRSTYDLKHSPPWLLLLLIVDQLVYHAVLPLFVIAITQLMRLYDEHMLEVFRFFFFLSAQTWLEHQ